jgi:AraC family transcriptional regulator, arabinose operon regulatory protein
VTRFMVDTRRQTFIQANFCTPSPEERKLGLCVNRASHWISRTLNYRPCGVDCHFLAYCINGSGEVRIGGQRYSVHRGDVAMVPPHTDSGMADDPALGWDIYWIHFSGHYVEHLANWAGFSILRPVLSHGLHPGTVDRFEHILSHLTEKRPHYVYDAAQEIFGLFCDIKKLTETTESNSAGLFSGINWRASDLNDLVKAGRCSKAHYIRKFKKATGISPWQYVLNLKIDKAKALLMDPGMSVKEISSELGFTHTSYFSRLFKRIAKQSPAAFRTEHQMQPSECSQHNKAHGPQSGVDV